MHIILGWAKAIRHVEGGHIISPLLRGGPLDILGGGGVRSKKKIHARN